MDAAPASRRSVELSAIRRGRSRGLTSDHCGTRRAVMIEFYTTMRVIGRFHAFGAARVRFERVHITGNIGLKCGRTFAWRGDSSPTAWTASWMASAFPTTSPLPLTSDQPGRQLSADHWGRQRCRYESELEHCARAGAKRISPCAVASVVRRPKTCGRPGRAARAWRRL